jgi:hypothetical protein
VSQGRYLHIEHEHRLNAHTNIHALNGIRTHDFSARASEDNSCLRPRGHCDQHLTLNILSKFLSNFIWNMHAKSLFRGNVPDLYSRGVWFEFRAAYLSPEVLRDFRQSFWGNAEAVL